MVPNMGDIPVNLEHQSWAETVSVTGLTRFFFKCLVALFLVSLIIAGIAGVVALIFIGLTK